MPRTLTDDPHSFSRPNEVVVTHVGLDLEVDFAKTQLRGSASLDLERRTPAASELVLDTWQLDIARVTGPDGTDLPFELAASDPELGSALRISIGAGTGVGAVDRVVVHYATDPDAGALQWLEPGQTSSGRSFLFTQSQPILARTWIPCQDSPGVRVTYDATIAVSPDLLALMSAENPVERAADGVYRFSMPQPVPSYLIALAVGDLQFRELGPRSGVYAEPDVVDEAAWEFADTEQMIAAAERLYGDYRWGRYDILVLPPSFPYGGMENPRLTFATPTVLAGDRSLVTLIAHELAHSWSGNLVTNSTWNDVWLNEGFTVYFETRIDEEMYGAAYTSMLLRLGRQDLERAVRDQAPRDTWLELDLAGRGADGPTKIPYEKGSLLLRLIEARVGRSRFDEFLRGYFDRFAFESMDTPTFLEHLRTTLLEPAGVSPEDLQLEAWVHGPGVPDNAPEFASDAFDRVEEQVARLLAGDGVQSVDVQSLDTEGWVSQQWVHLVRSLPPETDHEVLRAVDERFGFTASGNIEIATAWLELAVESGYYLTEPGVDEALAGFLTRHGRALYLRRVYQALAATDEGIARAREIYAVARPTYHPVSRSAIDRLLGWS